MSLSNELVRVAAVNPVPREVVTGERFSARARELRERLPGSVLAARRLSRLRIAVVAAVLAVATVGTALGARLLTESDVERYLPQGSVVFIGTDPQCTAVDEGTVYRCRLVRTPSRMTVTGENGEPAFRGTKFGTVDDDDRVNGGCVALNQPGTDWLCYLGERAVAEDVIDAGVLGRKQAGPAAG